MIGASQASLTSPDEVLSDNYWGANKLAHATIEVKRTNGKTNYVAVAQETKDLFKRGELNGLDFREHFKDKFTAGESILSYFITVTNGEKWPSANYRKCSLVYRSQLVTFTDEIRQEVITRIENNDKRTLIIK
ncbi:MAG: hypothetical protein HRU15_04300 [Planctomycetes bacterium]|nr:hypothetical protein [Planctomycetota bacterium]